MAKYLVQGHFMVFVEGTINAPNAHTAEKKLVALKVKRLAKLHKNSFTADRTFLLPENKKKVTR